jgi:hypothetical protein
VAKDAAYVVAPVSSSVKEKHDTTAIAVSTGSSTIENAKKMKEKLDATDVPTGSSGNKTLEKSDDAIIPSIGSSDNVSTGNEVKAKPDAITVGLSNHSIGTTITIGTATSTATSDTNKPDAIIVGVSDRYIGTMITTGTTTPNPSQGKLLCF